MKFVTATKSGRPVLRRSLRLWHSLRKTTIQLKKEMRIKALLAERTRPIWSNWPMSIIILYGCNYQRMIPIGTSIAQEFCRKGTGEIRKTSGLLPNCRMRNRLPEILRNLQQMPIKRQVQTVLYPMFPTAKIQLFPNTQVYLRKITKNNAIMSKITIFVPLLMYRVKSGP